MKLSKEDYKLDYFTISLLFTHPLNNSFSYFLLSTEAMKEFIHLDPKAIPKSVADENNIYLQPHVTRYVYLATNNKFKFYFSPIRFDFHFDIDEFYNNNIMEYIKKIDNILNSVGIEESLSLGFFINGVINKKASELKEYLFSSNVINYYGLDFTIKTAERNSDCIVYGFRKFFFNYEDIGFAYEVSTDVNTPIYDIKQIYSDYLSLKVRGLFDEF